MSVVSKMVLACVLVVLSNGCVGLGGGLLSTHDEVLIGVALSAELESRELLLTNDSVQEYVDAVGRKLVRVAERSHIPYTFKVIDDDSTINAFALPAGYFYVTTGFLRACENEAELSGIMAHELAHVIGRHQANVLSREYGSRLLRSQILGSRTGAARHLTLDILKQMTTLEFTRAQERESDRISTELMVRAGYDARGLPSILLKMYEKGVATEEQPDLFSGTLQPTPERLDRLYELYFEYSDEERDGLELFEAEYQERLLAELK